MKKKIAAIADEITDKGKRRTSRVDCRSFFLGENDLCTKIEHPAGSQWSQTCADINDDYYKERLNTPRKADGSYDFESVEAIDLDLSMTI